jgi:hypothetical protein
LTGEIPCLLPLLFIGRSNLDRQQVPQGK